MVEYSQFSDRAKELDFRRKSEANAQTLLLVVQSPCSVEGDEPLTTNRSVDGMVHQAAELFTKRVVDRGRQL